MRLDLWAKGLTIILEHWPKGNAVMRFGVRLRKSERNQRNLHAMQKQCKGKFFYRRNLEVIALAESSGQIISLEVAIPPLTYFAMIYGLAF